MLTLIGPSGVGKTRLALVIAQDVADHGAQRQEAREVHVGGVIRVRDGHIARITTDHQI
jgi:Holliday junction resolvasome RuvABC ATP-dependent DNA helicase subunit